MNVRFGSRTAALRGALALALLLAVAGSPGPARGDDRNLVQSGLRAPYVFILLDVSGSMHQSVTCSVTDIANGFCNQRCDQGDCLPRMMGDDPESKISVAKQSIYAIMQSTTNVNFGFGTFDQAGLHMSWKHWWYSLDSNQPNGVITLDDGTVYPAAGQQEVFGQQFWNCTDAIGNPGQNNALRYIGCGTVGNGNNAAAATPPQPA